VPSVEPSSTTTTSSGCSLARIERTVASMFEASLYAGTTTDTGAVTGSPQVKAGSRRRRAWRRATTTITTRRAMTSPPTPTRASAINLTTLSATPTVASSVQPTARSRAGAGCPCGPSPAASLTVVKR
jgi:hypothetical protein